MPFLKYNGNILNLNGIIAIRKIGNGIMVIREKGDEQVYYSPENKHVEEIFSYITALLVEGVNLIDVDLYLNQK